MRRSASCVFVKSGQNAALWQTRETNMDKSAPGRVKTLVVGSQTNRAIGTVGTLLFPNTLQDKPREHPWSSQIGTKEGRLLTCEHSDSSKGKPSGLSRPFPAGTSITLLEGSNVRPGSWRTTNKSGILANAEEKTQPLFPRDTTTLTVL